MTIDVGEKCIARVIKVLPFGAFVETESGDQGLLAISDIDWEPVTDITAALSVGDELEVEVIATEEGRIRFSRKALLPKPAGYERVEEEQRARKKRMAEATHLSLSDYDHENERHVEISIWPEGTMIVSRRIETNRDYLANDAPVPDDWSDDQKLAFSSGQELIAFCKRLTDELIQACFVFFDAGEEVDSDDARDAIEAALAKAVFKLDGSSATEPGDEQLEQLLEFPR